MNACPDDSDLLHFLDGRLWKPEADARIIAHIEECVSCQERLERLTRGSPTLGGGEPMDRVQNDPKALTDLSWTGVIAPDVLEDKPHGDSGRSRPTGSEGESSPQDRQGATNLEHIGDPNLSTSRIWGL